MDTSKIKVTDRRLFTEDGELRTDLDEPEDTAPESTQRAPAAARSASTPSAAPPPTSDERRSEPAAAGRPQFLDLVDLLGQQVLLAFGDPRLGPGAPPPDLRVARLYIDLLGVLQEKTRGNLTPEESAVLEDLIYQVRMAYVEKTRR